MSSVFATPSFDFLSSAEFVIRVVLFSIFAFSAVSSRNLFSCKIFCSTFSLALFLVFRIHVSKSHSIFRYICREWCVFLVTFKKYRNFFQTEVRKEP